MSPLVQVLSAAGPLPLKAAFTPPADGAVVFVATGTGWAHAAGTLIGFALQLNGVTIGQSVVFANASSMHLTIPTIFANGNIPSISKQAVTLIALGSTVTDLNDHFTVSILL